MQALKETNVDCDNGLKNYLRNYAKAVESLIVMEATMISPLDTSSEVGLLQKLNMINDNEDFDRFLKSNNLGERINMEPIPDYVPENTINLNETPNIPGTLNRHYSVSSSFSFVPDSNYNPIPPARQDFFYFGGNLIHMMMIDPEQEPIPKIVRNLVQYIEQTSFREEGLYRISGAAAQINQLKSLLDKNPDYPLEDIVTDCHTVTGCLKLFFRELNDSLFPASSVDKFMQAAKVSDPRLRLIQIHEQVNLLHDAHYATLKYILSHLWKVAHFEQHTKMNDFSLGIVWGPTLIRGAPNSEEMRLQSLIIEILIANYDHIFDIDGE
jgi:hypothetical protein